MSSTYLVADIGGTNARFAIAEGAAESGFTLKHVQRLRAEDFENLRDAANAFLESIDDERPDSGCIAVAGPVGGSVVRLTNSRWRFEPKELAEELRLKKLVAINDFAAQARGAPLCPADGVISVCPGTPQLDTPIAVLGPGTGLGLGLLMPGRDHVHVVATEGGHAGFAPRTDIEVEVGRFIADEYGFVSWERLLSGRGLVNIHRALCHIEGVRWPGHRPENITEEALANRDSLCGRVVDLFLAALGAYAGDISVITGARGGTFLAGGILPTIAGMLPDSAFNARRSRRGPMTQYVESIPVDLITTDAAALLGAGAIAEAGEA
ncbi:glucokinase [Hyphobacterium sp. HN65]|uniref:Glucokinase n=1 Tax=Hyphobacterium lacteum TaxID=3116575 RepID=A0ABU7LSC8_9PROT|nr:glucokinase [Hyphobacterium sp. HN65]MEE2526827.1 glucokinase [Hyphobacterium sp. HN65]